ncbi:MAG: radical SAM protein [Deltaproteobacteria bacterium]|nr:radical SAM protein [Deltaproteobacteria bacterium]
MDRTGTNLGRCRAKDDIGFANYLIHPGEEPPISGLNDEGGSGTIFFSHCNLSCVFCQNWQISQAVQNCITISVDRLVEIMFDLASSGAYNINLVSPTPHAVKIAQAIAKARLQGLNIPIVYNTGGYDSPACLAIMDGLVDIYLPDAKIGLAPEQDEDEPDSTSMRLFGAGDYVKYNRLALKEMKRQVGHLVVDGRGLAARGLLVRHLVLPDNIARTDSLLVWLRDNLGADLSLSLMAQYHPSNKIVIGDNPEFRSYPGLGRPLSVREYERWSDLAWELGLHNTFVQNLEAATQMRPDFNKPDVFN